MTHKGLGNLNKGHNIKVRQGAENVHYDAAEAGQATSYQPISTPFLKTDFAVPSTPSDENPWASLRGLKRIPTATLAAMLGMRLAPPVLRFDPARNIDSIPSHSTSWQDVCTTTTAHHAHEPQRPTGWPDIWTIAYSTDRVEHTVSVRNVDPLAFLDGDPVRNSTWHANSTARAGLHFMSTTGRLHWHESLMERDLLVVLDFDERCDEVASQPFTLTWNDGTKTRTHTPDFVAVIDGEVWLINVRPAARVNDNLLDNAAAIRTVCVLHGWREAVVVGYRDDVLTSLRTIGATNTNHDVCGVGGSMLDHLDEHGPTHFGDLVCKTAAPPLARAVLQHMIWDREVSVDLARVLTDETLVSLTPDATA